MNYKQRFAVLIENEMETDEPWAGMDIAEERIRLVLMEAGLTFHIVRAYSFVSGSKFDVPLNEEHV